MLEKMVRGEPTIGDLFHLVQRAYSTKQQDKLRQVVGRVLLEEKNLGLRNYFSYQLGMYADFMAFGCQKFVLGEHVGHGLALSRVTETDLSCVGLPYPVFSIQMTKPIDGWEINGGEGIGSMPVTEMMVIDNDKAAHLKMMSDVFGAFNVHPGSLTIVLIAEHTGEPDRLTSTTREMLKRVGLRERFNSDRAYREFVLVNDSPTFRVTVAKADGVYVGVENYYSRLQEALASDETRSTNPGQSVPSLRVLREALALVSNMCEYLSSSRNEVVRIPRENAMREVQLVRDMQKLSTTHPRYSKLHRRLNLFRVRSTITKIAPSIEEEMEKGLKRAQKEADTSGIKQAFHVVRGHFQRYWYGPRNATMRECVWKWKNPFEKGDPLVGTVEREKYVLDSIEIPNE